MLKKPLVLIAFLLFAFASPSEAKLVQVGESPVNLDLPAGFQPTNDRWVNPKDGRTAVTVEAPGSFDAILKTFQTRANGKKLAIPGADAAYLFEFQPKTEILVARYAGRNWEVVLGSPQGLSAALAADSQQILAHAVFKPFVEKDPESLRKFSIDTRRSKFQFWRADKLPGGAISYNYTLEGLKTQAADLNRRAAVFQVVQLNTPFHPEQSPEVIRSEASRKLGWDASHELKCIVLKMTAGAGYRCSGTGPIKNEANMAILEFYFGNPSTTFLITAISPAEANMTAEAENLAKTFQYH